MSNDARLLRGVNTIGAAVVASVVLFVGYASWQLKDSSRSESLVPGLTEYREHIRKARLATSQDRLSEAEREYRQALDVRPGSPSVVLELANFYEDHGQVEKASAQYELVAVKAIKAVEAHRSSPADLESLVHYADLCLKLGKVDRARTIYEAAINGYLSPTPLWSADQKGVPPLAVVRAESYHRVGRHTDAIALNPQHWPAYRAAASDRSASKSALWLGRFSRAIQKYPNDVAARGEYAATLETLGKRLEAINYLESAMRRFSGEERASLARHLEQVKRNAAFEARLRAGDPSATGSKLPPGGRAGPPGGFGGPGGPWIGGIGSG